MPFFDVTIGEIATIMKPTLAVALLLFSGLVLLASCEQVKDKSESDSRLFRFKRTLKPIPAGLLEPVLPLVKAIVPEPLLGKITMLLPLITASDSAAKESA